jgi:hypothetical protein
MRPPNSRPSNSRSAERANTNNSRRAVEMMHGTAPQPRPPHPRAAGPSTYLNTRAIITTNHRGSHAHGTGPANGCVGSGRGVRLGGDRMRDGARLGCVCEAAPGTRGVWVCRPRGAGSSTLSGTGAGRPCPSASGCGVPSLPLSPLVFLVIASGGSASACCWGRVGLSNRNAPVASPGAPWRVSPGPPVPTPPSGASRTTWWLWRPRGDGRASGRVPAHVPRPRTPASHLTSPLLGSWRPDPLPAALVCCPPSRPSTFARW